MTQNLLAPNGYRTFASVDAPYFEYLNNLPRRWDEVQGLWDGLQKALDTLSHARIFQKPRITGSSDTTVCCVYDVRADYHRNCNTITTTAQVRRSHIQGHSEGFANLHGANDFFNALRYCEADVHTRIVVCQDSHQAQSEDTWAIEALFFGHLLGIELDLPPAFVYQLSQRRHIKELPRVRRYQNPKLIDACVKLQMRNGQNDNVGICLGRRAFGIACPQLVVVSLQDFRFGRSKKDSIGSAGNLCEPQVFSQRSMPLIQLPQLAEPIEYLSWAMNSSLSNTSPLEAHMQTGSWLSALIHMQALNYAESLDSIMAVSRDGDDDRMIDLARVVYALQSSQLQITRIQEHLPTMRRSDFSEALGKLIQVLGEAEVLRETAKETLEDRFRIKSIDAAVLSVSQSRSAVALTILASIFVPMNLASSIFGMNVQEINETGHSIWTFVTTAAALLIFSGLGFILRRTLRRRVPWLLKMLFKTIGHAVRVILKTLGDVVRRIFKLLWGSTCWALRGLGNGFVFVLGILGGWLLMGFLYVLVFVFSFALTRDVAESHKSAFEVFKILYD